MRFGNVSFFSYIMYTSIIKQTLMPIKNINELEKCLGIMKDKGWLHHGTFFRGEVNNTWKLLPGISRGRDATINFQKLEETNAKEALRRISKLSLFQNNTLGAPNTSFEDLQRLQHVGLKTTLIDFSADIYVAAYFATKDDPIYNESNGRIWVCAKGHEIPLVDSTECYRRGPTIFDLNIDCIVMGEVDAARVYDRISTYNQSQQRGLFIKSSSKNIHLPIEENNSFEPNLRSIEIPAEYKKQIHQDLKKKFLHELCIKMPYPEIINIIDKINENTNPSEFCNSSSKAEFIIQD
jgi:hypothetical protein